MMIYLYDGLVNSQLKRRFWPSYGARSPYYRRLNLLVQNGFLRVARLPSATSWGSGPSWVTLGPAALPLLAEHLGLSIADLSHLRRNPPPLYWQHEREVRDFRLALEIACEATRDVSLQGWTNERVFKASPIKVNDPARKAMLDLVPDGAFTLALTRGAEQSFYLELDRATLMSPQRFKAKLAAYLLHGKRSPIPVLFIVPTPERLKAISRWAHEEAGNLSADPTIVWLTSQERISEQTILSQPIWSVVGGPAALPLVPAELGSPIRALPSSGELIFQEATRS